ADRQTDRQTDMQLILGPHEMRNPTVQSPTERWRRNTSGPAFSTSESLLHTKVSAALQAVKDEIAAVSAAAVTAASSTPSTVAMQSDQVPQSYFDLMLNTSQPNLVRRPNGPPLPVKIFVMGAGGSGRSNLVLRFINNSFIPDYDPAIEDSYRKFIPTTMPPSASLPPTSSFVPDISSSSSSSSSTSSMSSAASISSTCSNASSDFLDTPPTSNTSTTTPSAPAAPAPPIMLEVLDQGGREYHPDMEVMRIHQSDAFIVTYSVASRQSFEEALEKLETILAHGSRRPSLPLASSSSLTSSSPSSSPMNTLKKGANTLWSPPVYLVACQCDRPPREWMVKREEVAHTLSSTFPIPIPYREVSAKEGWGVDEVFREALNLAWPIVQCRERSNTFKF
ncbi:GTP-binding protein Di-Ras1, partial [Quaeritorhiza haematococci]